MYDYGSQVYHITCQFKALWKVEITLSNYSKHDILVSIKIKLLTLTKCIYTLCVDSIQPFMGMIPTYIIRHRCVWDNDISIEHEKVVEHLSYWLEDFHNRCYENIEKIYKTAIEKT